MTPQTLLTSVLTILMIVCFLLALWPLAKNRRRQQLIQQKQQIFDRLYHDVDSAEISVRNRKTLGLDSPCFTYGEIIFTSFADILAMLQPQSHEIFYDLGAGSGKAVFCAALLYPWRKCYGVELLPDLHQLSLGLLEKLQRLLKPKLKSVAIEFKQADFLTYDFTDADVVFINSASFSGDFWDALLQRLQLLKVGTRIVLTSKHLDATNYQLLDAQMYMMSWGINSVYIYKKII